MKKSKTFWASIVGFGFGLMATAIMIFVTWRYNDRYGSIFPGSTSELLWPLVISISVGIGVGLSTVALVMLCKKTPHPRSP